MIEQMANFNRERIPERQPHAKGGGAFGRFEVTGRSKYTKAAVFQPGTKTDMLVRFSTVAGERGSPEPGVIFLWEGSERSNVWKKFQLSLHRRAWRPQPSGDNLPRAPRFDHPFPFGRAQLPRSGGTRVATASAPKRSL